MSVLSDSELSGLLTLFVKSNKEPLGKVEEFESRVDTSDRTPKTKERAMKTGMLMIL